MADRDLPAERKRLLDPQESADRLGIWCRSVDTRYFTALTQVFHPDIVWDFGKGIVERGLDKLIGRIEAHMLGASFCGARHIHLSNLCPRFEGGTAVSDA